MLMLQALNVLLAAISYKAYCMPKLAVPKSFLTKFSLFLEINNDFQLELKIKKSKIKKTPAKFYFFSFCPEEFPRKPYPKLKFTAS